MAILFISPHNQLSKCRDSVVATIRFLRQPIQILRTGHLYV